MSLTLSLAESIGEPVVVTDSEAVASDNTTTYDLSSWAAPATLTASTTPPITKVAKGTLTLSGGAATLDLTAVVSGAATIDFTGLKIQRIFLKCPSTNANVIQATKGASNGYGLNAAAATWLVALDPSAWTLIAVADTAPDVAAGAKDIDVTGTGSQTLQYLIVGG